MANAKSLLIPLGDPEATESGRFGPKAANLAALGRAGLPIPGGFCLDVEAYRIQLAALGLEDSARKVMTAEIAEARQHALAMRLGLLEQPIVPELREPLLAAHREVTRSDGVLTAVRSSALVEDRAGSSFAGQFESFLGLKSEADFLTTVRACWAALWSVRALRYMATHDIDPAETGMAIIVQPMINAVASGGGLSRTAEGGMLASATWGLGEAIAQGEVVPDRYTLTADGAFVEVVPGVKDHQVGCAHHAAPASAAVPEDLVGEPCLSPEQVAELGQMMLLAEEVIGGPAEIEWAMDEAGIKLVQARPLRMEAPTVPDEIWLNHPRLRGHPAGIGWGTGRACVVNCECELGRVAPGDILVTKAAGPSLSQVLPRVAGVVAERGGSTSHLASLARERGIPMVLGVIGATNEIPDGSMVAVDGVAGIVRWMQ